MIKSYWNDFNNKRMVTIIFPILTGADNDDNLDVFLSDDDTVLVIKSKVPGCMVEDQLDELHADVSPKGANYFAMIKSLQETVQGMKRTLGDADGKGIHWWTCNVKLNFPCVQETYKPYAAADGTKLLHSFYRVRVLLSHARPLIREYILSSLIIRLHADYKSE